MYNVKYVCINEIVIKYINYMLVELNREIGINIIENFEDIIYRK